MLERDLIWLSRILLIIQVQMSCWLDCFTLLMLISIITNASWNEASHMVLCLTSPDMCLRMPIWLILKRKYLLLPVKCITTLVVITNPLKWKHSGSGIDAQLWLLMNFVPLQEKTWIVWGKWLKENPFTKAACLLPAEIKLKLCRFVDCL